MVTAAKVVGWFLFCLVCFAGAMRVTNDYGQLPGFGLVGLSLLAAWTAHTERSRYFVGLFEAAVVRFMKREAAAITMDVPASRLSEGFRGTEQLSFSKACELPDDVWFGFATDVLERSGQYVVIKTGALADLVEAVRAQAVRRVA